MIVKRGNKHMVKSFLVNFFKKLRFNPFSRRNHVKLGLYGPPNGGKSTLANRICQDWLGEEMSSVSHIAHETREINIKEQVTMKNKKGKELTFSLVDTPGIATKIDYEDFIKRGISKTEAKKRAKEATRGVIDSIKWLDDMDSVIVVLDSTKDPYSQVNITIIGNLQARNIPVLIAANKVDLKRSNLDVIKAAFPQYEIVGVSAKYGKNIEDFYDQLFKFAK
jgi:GTPase